MKLLHLSDLHLGKRLNEFSMLEEQTYILTCILAVIDQEQPDGVILAGDIYDKSVPSGEAVQLFDQFLCQLAERNQQVFVISGNHDSPERLSFGGRLMRSSGIHIAPVYDGCVEAIDLEDAHGPLRVYLLPFVKPAHVRRFFPEESIESYTDALRVAVKQMRLDRRVRNILVTHQFVTGAQRSDSEEISVGGSDNVDASVFQDFDYVALGHIHGPQNVGKETIRYCGTPLKYSFSEAKHQKSVTLVELGEKGVCSVRAVPLTPKRDLRELRGTYMELTRKSFYEGTNVSDYLHITLTDEEDIPEAIGKLRAVYPNLMRLDYDNQRTRKNVPIVGVQEEKQVSPLELFAEFYAQQNNREMSQEQETLMKRLVEEIWGEEL